MSDILPMESTDTVEELGGEHIRRVRQFWHTESAVLDEARLDFEWLTSVHFTHPSTWTQEEVERSFVQLAARMARAQSIELLKTVPDPVMPVILPQLRELAEYEVRMWNVRQEVQGPDIRERWISLPITTA